MDVRGNGGSGGDSVRGSSGIGSGKNSGFWDVLIFKGGGLIVSVVHGVVIHIAAFVF